MTRPEQGQLIWQLLVNAAHQRQTLTYEIVGEAIGAHSHVISQALGHVMHYCDQEGLKPLTVLVVHKSSGLAGHGLTTVDPRDQLRVREQVYRIDWRGMVPPSADELRAAWDAG